MYGPGFLREPVFPGVPVELGAGDRRRPALDRRTLVTAPLTSGQRLRRILGITAAGEDAGGAVVVDAVGFAPLGGPAEVTSGGYGAGFAGSGEAGPGEPGTSARSGASVVGSGVNGHSASGHGANSHRMNGHGANGHRVNGRGVVGSGGSYAIASNASDSPASDSHLVGSRAIGFHASNSHASASDVAASGVTDPEAAEAAESGAVGSGAAGSALARLAGAAFDPGRPGVRALAAVAVVVVAGAAALAWWSRPRVEPVPPSPVVTAAPAATPSTPAEIVVAVTGLVHRPGLVRLAPGARVADAVDAAGGALPEADLSQLNLARRLADGELVAVGVPPPPGEGGVPAGEPGKVNLNTATQAELETLPGIGPALAQRILAWREANGGFSSVDQLREVSGIGEVRFAELRELVTV